MSGGTEKSQFAGFGVAPERDALRAVPAQLQLDQPSMPLSHLPSEAASGSTSPAARKQVCHQRLESTPAMLNNTSVAGLHTWGRHLHAALVFHSFVCHSELPACGQSACTS